MSDPKRSVRSGRARRWSLVVLAATGFGLGLWLGCNPLAPDGDGVVAGSTKTVNNPPTITITMPSTSMAVSKGGSFTIAWDDTDPDDNALVLILLDPDTNPDNGNEVLVHRVQEDPDGPVNDSIEVDTATFDLAVGTYRIIAMIQDNVGNVATDIPAITIEILPEGVSPVNQPPKITIHWPTENIGAVHGDVICVYWEASDADDPGATVMISLDYDLDPSNDDDPTNPNPPIVLATGLPLLPVDPNTVDISTINPNDPNCSGGFAIEIDTTGQVPPRADGLPYYIQFKVEDGVNPPVYAYAIGWLTVQKWAAGVVDLADAGTGLAGAIFQGFHGRADPLDPNQKGGNAGSSAAALGDFDGDGYGDFIIAARYGNPRGRGYIGQAYMIYGRSTRFSSTNSLNSVGTNIRGAQFHAPKDTPDICFFGIFGDTVGGDGGLASVTAVEDLDGDGKPEILFGLPDVYTHEAIDDDPRDSDSIMYFDDLPYPYSSSEPGNDDYWCDRMSLVVYVSSQQDQPWNQLEQNTIDLRMVGQHDPGPLNRVDDENFGWPGDAVPRGARFRGDHPRVLGATRFGETVCSIADTDNNGTPELVFSAPDANDGYGRIDIYLGQDFTTSGPLPVKSFPWYYVVGDPWDLAEGTMPEGSEITQGSRRHLSWPGVFSIVGARAGDHLGRALPADDFNQDGSPDIACGAPDADRNNLTDCGVAYIVFGQLDFGYISVADHPRMEIVGTSSGDRLGETQGGIGDFNGDGIDDVVVGSRFVDEDGVVDAGAAAILFGGRRYTGEQTYSMADAATPALPGVKLIGATPGAMAGAMVGSAGDFNGDGRDDILICAPGAEYTFTAGGRQLTRLGVAYLIFGNTKVANKTFKLDKVATAELPGIVLVSPYEKGSADEAGVDTCFAIGDINGDGYDDILIGNTTADYVNPANPSQRRIDAGECYVIYGNNFGTNDPDRW